MYVILFCITEIDVPVTGLCIKDENSATFRSKFNNYSYDISDVGNTTVYYFKLTSNISSIRDKYDEEVELNTEEYAYDILELKRETLSEIFLMKKNKCEITKDPFYIDEPYSIEAFECKETYIFETNYDNLQGTIIENITLSNFVNSYQGGEFKN